MANSLNTGVSGLLAHQRQLDMVANNLANINTTGYKSQRIVFSDLLYETLSPATGGNGVAIGGTNPIQLGSGVRTSQISRNFSQGGFNPTGQALDFALQGDGFFVVSDGSQRLFTRSGSFAIDQAGYLINPANGYRVQRFGSVGETNLNGPSFQVAGDDAIRVPLGQTILGRATSQIGFGGILDATASGPKAQVLTSANAFLAGAVPATLTTLINGLNSNIVDYQAGDAIDITGTNQDGSPINVSLSVNGTTTMGDLVNAINANLTGAVASVDSSGNLVVRSDDDGPSMVALTLSDATANVGGTDFYSHSMVASTIGSNGEVLSGETEIFDVRGGAHTLGYQFQKTDLNTWSLTFSLPSGEGSVISDPIEGIQFTDDGTFVGIAGAAGSLGSVTINFDDILNNQTFGIELADMVQIASSFSMSVEQDGLEPGAMSNLRINSDGVLQGISTTGQVFDVAQMAIALFRNPQGLDALGDSNFRESLNSGKVELGAAASGGRGAIRGGSLEGSNVDVAFEFTQLIVAQRGFSANARVITIADQVLEELTNIVR